MELNEAFAVQSLAVIEDLGVDPELVNVNGGAIAHRASAWLFGRTARDHFDSRDAIAREKRTACQIQPCHFVRWRGTG